MLRSLEFLAPCRLRLAWVALILAGSGFVARAGAQTPEELEAGRTGGQVDPAGQTSAPSRPSAPPEDAAQRVPAPASEGWARVKEHGGTAVRRYAGEREDAFGTLASGTVVRVRGDYNGWRRVSVPGGLEGWVATSFLKAGEHPRERIVNADRVNFRVRPTTTDNAPLEPDRLERDERVLVLEQRGDWVKVQTPPRISGWVDSVHLEALSDGATAERSFEEQQSQRLSALIAEMEKAEAERAYLASDAYADKMVAPADQLRDAELAKGTAADLKTIRAAYDALLAPGANAAEPSAKLKERVAVRLRELEGKENQLAIRAAEEGAKARIAEIEKEAERSRQEALKLQQREHAPTPDRVLENWQYFGWLRKEGEQTLSAGPVRYVLERGRKPKLNVMCDGGRYDLSDYVGREIAVRGVERSDFSLPVFEVKQVRILTSKRAE